MILLFRSIFNVFVLIVGTTKQEDDGDDSVPPKREKASDSVAFGKHRKARNEGNEINFNQSCQWPPENLLVDGGLLFVLIVVVFVLIISQGFSARYRNS